MEQDNHWLDRFLIAFFVILKIHFTLKVLEVLHMEDMQGIRSSLLAYIP